MNNKQSNIGTTARPPRKTLAPSSPSKKARLEAMLRRPKGVAQKQLEKSLGWQPNIVRAAISLLHKGGAAVTLDWSAKTPTYRIGGAS